MASWLRASRPCNIYRKEGLVILFPPPMAGLVGVTDYPEYRANHEAQCAAPQYVHVNLPHEVLHVACKHHKRHNVATCMHTLQSRPLKSLVVFVPNSRLVTLLEQALGTTGASAGSEQLAGYAHAGVQLRAHRTCMHRAVRLCMKEGRTEVLHLYMPPRAD